ncbi:DeoR/GlpR family DNA-binding transcription regulator [Paenibacillus sp.]|uniref:DeoR/GlpR family DNA-binding transcription regulator n=1 Tax=Paenibacillus sp. TaxID=58172 RepID=UPI002810A9D5|nr:DeoR/GlpR family DNA-binding transcription regulator [Paenibacillus sp.]
MLVAERLQRIVDLVNERKSIRVSELSELCDVTEETIRRDLDKLEAEGKLARTHGGAISLAETRTEVPYYEREIVRSEEKRRIAEEAVKLIRPKDRILLDASSTAWYMARLIPDMPLTVLTNSIKAAVELAGKEKIQVISTGGILSPGSLSYVGPLAERALEQYHVGRLFLSCKGARLDRGLSESNELQALVKQRMIAAADEVVLLADHTKFEVQAFTHVAGWDRVTRVVTDAGTAAGDVARLREMGIDVTQLTASSS